MADAQMSVVGCQWCGTSSSLVTTACVLLLGYYASHTQACVRRDMLYV